MTTRATSTKFQNFKKQNDRRNTQSRTHIINLSIASQYSSLEYYLCPSWSWLMCPAQRRLQHYMPSSPWTKKHTKLIRNLNITLFYGKVISLLGWMSILRNIWTTYIQCKRKASHFVFFSSKRCWGIGSTLGKLIAIPLTFHSQKYPLWNFTWLFFFPLHCNRVLNRSALVSVSTQK